MRVKIGTSTAAGLLFLAGAVGVVGSWALGAAVVLLVGLSVATVISWEERDAALVPAPVEAPELESV